MLEKQTVVRADRQKRASQINIEMHWIVLVPPRTRKNFSKDRRKRSAFRQGDTAVLFGRSGSRAIGSCASFGIDKVGLIPAKLELAVTSADFAARFFFAGL